MEGLPFDIEDHTLRAMRVKNQGSLKHLPVENAVGTAGRIAASRQHNRKNAMIAQTLKSVSHGATTSSLGHGDANRSPATTSR